MAAKASDATMYSRTPVAHFLELVKGFVIERVLLVKNDYVESDFGHLVIGQDCFFLCSCLQVLVKGLPCRHGFAALKSAGVVFDGESIALRWRLSVAPWTVETVTAKPARALKAGTPTVQQSTELGAIVFTQSNQNVRAANHADFVAFGKEASGASAAINSRGGAARVLSHLKLQLETAVKVELQTQSTVARRTIFKAAFSRRNAPTNSGTTQAERQPEVQRQPGPIRSEGGRGGWQGGGDGVRGGGGAGGALVGDDGMRPRVFVASHPSTRQPSREVSIATVVVPMVVPRQGTGWRRSKVRVAACLSRLNSPGASVHRSARRTVVIPALYSEVWCQRTGWVG